MRHIGQLNTSQEASRFGDFLTVQGVVNEMERNADGTYTVWVVDEELVAAAQEHLQTFRASPAHPRYQGLEPKVRETADREREEAATAARRIRHRGDIVASAAPFGVGPFCAVLLFAMAVVFLTGGQGKSVEGYSRLLIGIKELLTGVRLQEVREGEVWRLITPIFLHFGWLHLLMNSLWIASLGSLLEARRGIAFLMPFVLVTAVLPNLAQYWSTGSPFFGGMSGVTFAMAGYAWQRGRQDPGSGIGLESGTMIMLTIFFLVGWLDQLNLLGGLQLLGAGTRMANMVHTVGLGIGIGWGWYDARRRLA